MDMFKRKNIFLLVTVVAISFTGCSFQGDITDGKIYYGYATETIAVFKDGVQENNIDKMKEYVDNDKSLDNFTLDTKSSKDEIEEKTIKVLNDYKNECAKKLDISINATDEDNEIVTVDCKYVDANEFVKAFLQEVDKIKKNKSLDDKQKEANIDEALERTKKNVDYKIIEKELKIDIVKKDGNEKIKEVNKDLYEVITANVWNSYEACK